ncbi:MAG: hypothetical protein ACTSYC_07975 [Promethearchaeota archaeon]
MFGRKIDDRTVSIPEVKKIMEDLNEKIMEIDSEEGLSHFQEITYNYVQKFAKMDDKTAKKIIKHLMETYDIEEEFAINIVNVDPKTIPELHIILEKSFHGKTFDEEQLRQILYEIEELKS